MHANKTCFRFNFEIRQRFRSCMQNRKVTGKYQNLFEKERKKCRMEIDPGQWSSLGVLYREIAPLEGN